MKTRFWSPLGAALTPLTLLTLGLGAAHADTNLALTITDKGCEPNQIAASAGQVTVEVTNASTRVVEWEILSGVMVVAERENILPGFKQSISAKLAAGDYGLTCGLLSNPRGVLTVGADGSAKVGPVDPMQLVGPLSEYKIYVQTEADALVKATEAFVAAIKAGDVEKARGLFAATRMPYERIEPIAELFSDLDSSIDARADDWEKREADPGFTGFHRLEYALFSENSTAGMEAVADRLLADVTTLQGRIKTLTVPPATMIGGAAGLIEEVAASKISGEEDRYSGTDLADFQANMEGAQKILELVTPLVAERDADLLARTNANFKTVDEVLTKYRKADGSFANYKELTDADRRALQGPIAALAEDLARLSGILGIQNT